jgi:hypothetical protein
VSRKAERAARKVGQVGEKGARTVGEWNSWLDREAQGVGERTTLLTKDGAGDSEISERMVWHREDCEQDCCPGTRRSAAFD